MENVFFISTKIGDLIQIQTTHDVSTYHPGNNLTVPDSSGSRDRELLEQNNKILLVRLDSKCMWK